MSESEPMSEMLELVAVHGPGGLTADQQQRLHELLAGSAELRRVFVQEQLMDAAFHLETPGSAEMETPLAVLPRRRWAGVRRGRWVAAAAVIFLLGLALGGMIPFPKVPALVVEDTETMDDGIALVTREVDAEWEGENTPVAGSILSEGML